MRSFFIVTTVLLCSCTFATLGVSKSRNDPSAGQAQDVLVQGVIQSVFKVPIPKLPVTLRNAASGNIMIETSDSDGRFQFITPEGKYVLSAVLGKEMTTQSLRVTVGRHPVHLTIDARARVHFGNQSAVSVSQLTIPRDANNALRRGIEASTKNKTAEAMASVNKAIDLYPHYAEAFGIRAVLERRTKPYQALIDAQKAIEYDPYIVKGYVALGSVYTLYGRFDDAVRTLNRAIAIQPDSWLAHYEMTRALVGKQDYIAALTQLQRTCSLVPKNPPYLHLLKADVLIGLNDISSATKELEAYLKEAPSSPESVQASMALAGLQDSRSIEAKTSKLHPGPGD
jgi:tetratricopeptide (TPR) repeat protein